MTTMGMGDDEDRLTPVIHLDSFVLNFLCLAITIEMLVK